MSSASNALDAGDVRGDACDHLLDASLFVQAGKGDHQHPALVSRALLRRFHPLRVCR
jgi:hypothetical protein